MEVLDKVFNETKLSLEGVEMHKKDLLEEVHFFELSMKQLKNHPWKQIAVYNVQLDTSSSLYNKIQSAYVGDDPEEDYKQVIVWKMADMLFITAAVDHDKSIPVKWDVVVYE